jgi:hypothetical protein
MWGVEIVKCPLHTAAGDLYTALDPLVERIGAYLVTLSAPPYGITFDMYETAKMALLKANPQRTQEEKTDAE